MSPKKESTQEDFIIREYRDGDFKQIAEIWRQTDMGNPQRGDYDVYIIRDISKI
jgi:hypothetical protein